MSGVEIFAVIALSVQNASIVDGASNAAMAINGSAVQIAGVRYELSGIDAPDLVQYCKRPSGAIYACGKESVRALAGLIKEAEPRCSGEVRNNVASQARCTVHGRDIGEYLVRNGYALAAGADGMARYGVSEKLAKREKRGMWGGSFVTPSEWRIARTQAVPISSKP